MSFFKNLFCKEKKSESVVCIDIAAESVAGAYVHYSECETTPALIYGRRLPIEIRKDEPHENAMVRALEILGNELIREGAPALLRAVGSGSADAILVSIDAPWQETKVRTEHFERDRPFLFTKSMVTAAMQKTRAETPGKMLADESVIGTILNGYETHHPYGRKVHRASIIVLSSLIEEKVTESISATLRGIFHTKNIQSIAGSSLRYQALRAAFPHERDGLIIDATEHAISIALIRNGLFTALAEVADLPKDRQWIDVVADECTGIAEKYPLPRIIFLLAREQDMDSFHKMLESGDFGKLWLSDNPPTIIPVLAGHLSSLVHQTATAPPDLQLLLMTLFYQHREML